MKNFLFKALDLLGLTKSTNYEKAHLHRANMRSGLFMAAIVAILEIWLIIRQHVKYIIPAMAEEGANYFEQLFNSTSLFWLLMTMAITMFVYCFIYLKDRTSKRSFIIQLIVVGIGLTLCFLLPLESRIKNYNPKRLVDTILLITLYSTIALFHLSIIAASILKYKGKNYEWLTSVLIISLFALICLVFGVKVSYSDFFSTKEEKQIICFLTMVVYVACLLIWKPYLSVALLGAVFLGFFFLLESNAEQRPLPEGDQVNYITFFVSLAMVTISIYNQRITEARKDEELEILATQDKLTGLYAFEYFTSLCEKKIVNENLKPEEWIYLFIDVTSFKTYNDQHGFDAGNIFLKEVGNILTSELPDSLISRQSDDHFVAFTKNKEISAKVEQINAKVEQLDLDIQPGIRVGGYILKDVKEGAHYSVQKARYAFGALKRNSRYLEYDEKMQERYNMIQYIVAHIDEAVNNDWVLGYYQPVVYAKDRKLCGVECLSRWNDPKYGFLSPGLFIPALEDAQLAYKLDLKMLEIVCKNMRAVLDNKKTIVPTSINFSRADFSIVDVPSEVFRITEKYQIPPKYLHIEITESALLEEHVDLKDAMRRMKEKGFTLWLDDFGSGYSSFNTLKDYDFDVLKLDMEFLKGFENNPKSKSVIKAVIEMAKQVNMRTLCEGVESEEQAKFLKEIGCERLQGYLISKPISYEELNESISSGKFTIGKDVDKLV